MTSGETLTVLDANEIAAKEVKQVLQKLLLENGSREVDDAEVVTPDTLRVYLVVLDFCAPAKSKTDGW